MTTSPVKASASAEQPEPMKILERAVTRYGWLPSSNVLAEAQAWIEAHRYTACAICDDPLDLEGRSHVQSRLMANPAPIVCRHCFALWYDGLTDSDQIRAARDRQRASP